jgi:hypothetical protein
VRAKGEGAGAPPPAALSPATCRRPALAHLVALHHAVALEQKERHAPAALGDAQALAHIFEARVTDGGDDRARGVRDAAALCVQQHPRCARILLQALQDAAALQRGDVGGGHGGGTAGVGADSTGGRRVGCGVDIAVDGWSSHERLRWRCVHPT